MATPQQIANRCKEIGMESIAITDHDVVMGHIDFHKTMVENNIRPILGIEAYQAPTSRFTHESAQTDKATGKRIENFHLILLAHNKKGLRNLWALNSESHRSGFYHHGRVDWELLQKYNEGLICTSSCVLGLLPQLVQHGDDYSETLNKYLNIFGDRFFIEMNTYTSDWQRNVNIKLANIANEWGVPLVYGNDSHYASIEDYGLHEAIMAIQFNQKLKDMKEPYHEPCLFIMDEFDIRDSLFYLKQHQVDEAISNSVDIAKMCDVQLPDNRKRIPVFIPGEKWLTSWDMFFDLVQEGFTKKVTHKGLDRNLYLERVKKEMLVIQKASLYDYFLMVRDYILFAKNNNIAIGPGRGSVGGSLIAYLLDITSVDPIRFDLIFERFYNIGREKSLPDIDTDCSTKGRERVKEYIAKKYGQDCVADLGTLVGLKAKGAVNDLSRVMSIPLETAREIAEILDTTVDAGIQPDWTIIHSKVENELQPYIKKYPRMFEWAEQLYGHIRSYGVHASGVIIGDAPLDDIFPLRWMPKDKKMVTQWPMETAEEFGYMKIDLLGLRNLDTFEEVDKILQERGKDPIDWEMIHEMDHPEELWQLLEKGLTVGLFQVEEGQMAKSLAKRMRPRSIEELANLIALNRPGPLESGDIDLYIRHLHDKKLDIHYPHEFLKKVSENTYGVVIYQEQIIEFMTLIGYTPEEADNFRSIMGKKKVHEIKQAKDDFLIKASQHMATSVAEGIWQKFEFFSKYGFNKSHAIAYGIVLLRSMYAKYHYPAEFLLAGIRTVDKTDIHRYISEARKMGIEILPPDVNSSGIETNLVGDKILFGLSNIKYVGKQPARWIIENRPFSSLEDLVQKSQERKITLPGGMRKVAINSRQYDILWQLKAIESTEKEHNINEWKLIELEEEYLGVPFSDKTDAILYEYHDDIEQFCTPVADAEEPGNYFLAGGITDVEERKTKKGDPYLVVQIRDKDWVSAKIYAWGSQWDNTKDKYKFMLMKNRVGVFEVKKTERGFTLIGAKLLLSRLDGKKV